MLAFISIAALIFVGCFFAEYDDGWRGR